MREHLSALSRMTNSRIPSKRVQIAPPVAWGRCPSHPPGGQAPGVVSGHPILIGKPVDKLSPQAEALDELLVAVVVLSLEVVDQAPSLADNPQQTAPGVVVFIVVLEMLGQFGEPCSQQRHLDLGRSGVRVVVLVSVNCTSLCLSRDQLLFLWLSLVFALFRGSSS